MKYIRKQKREEKKSSFSAFYVHTSNTFVDVLENRERANSIRIFGNSSLVFVLAFSALLVLLNVTHTVMGRPSSHIILFSSQFYSLPFRTEEKKLTKNALGRQHTTCIVTLPTHSHFPLFSLAVYLLPKNIEIIKKKVFGCSLNLIHF